MGEADDVHALGEHRVGHPRRQGRVAEHHRHDRMLARQDREAAGAHLRAEEPRVGLEPVAQVGRFLEHADRLERSGRHRRSDGVREQVGP